MGRDPDYFRIKVKGTIPIGKEFVEKVEFVDAADAIVKTIDNTGNAAARKEFAKFCNGFTNHEYCDFSDLSNASLHIRGHASDVNLEWTLYDVRVYKNLPGSNFSLENYLNAGATIPIYSNSSLVVNAGADILIPLGSVIGGTYVLVTAQSMSLRDLQTNEVTLTDVPLSFAQNVVVSAIPSVSEWGLIILALLLLTAGTLAISRRRIMLAGAGSNGGSLPMGARLPLFHPALFVKVLFATVIAAGVGITVVVRVTGSITRTDAIGTLLSAVIAAYLIHLWILLRKD